MLWRAYMDMHYQGYLFGRPMPVDEFDALLVKSLFKSKGRLSGCCSRAYLIVLQLVTVGSAKN